MTNTSLPLKWGIIAVMGFIVSVSTVFAKNKTEGANNAKKSVPAAKRDPFWPVGFVPTGVQKIEMEEKQVKRPVGDHDWNGAMKLVVINGVSHRGGNEYVAIVNTKMKQVGDTITVSHQGVSYTWAVDHIKPPGSVKLRRVSAL